MEAITLIINGSEVTLEPSQIAIENSGKEGGKLSIQCTIESLKDNRINLIVNALKFWKT